LSRAALSLSVLEIKLERKRIGEIEPDKQEIEQHNISLFIFPGSYIRKLTLTFFSYRRVLVPKRKLIFSNFLDSPLYYFVCKQTFLFFHDLHVLFNTVMYCIFVTCYIYLMYTVVVALFLR